MHKQEQIQALYSAHRVRRNGQQKEKFLSPELNELIIDPWLLRLENPEIEPGFKDLRNCMTFWGRPPLHVLELAEKIQSKLKAVAPSKFQSVCSKDSRGNTHTCIPLALLVSRRVAIYIGSNMLRTTYTGS